MGKTVNIGGRIHNPEVGNVVSGANEILDDTKGKKQNVINSEVDTALAGLNFGKQDKLTFDQTPTESSTNPVTSCGVYEADKVLQEAIEAILLLIPSAASALNQLADKAFVNSSIATNTAEFRGTYNLVSDLHLTVSASHQDIANALLSEISIANNGDYAFVQVPTSDTSSDIRVTERYKFNDTIWQYEYDLNNSGFTSQQWEAINSTITLALVQKLSSLPTAAELAILFNGKQNTLIFDNVPVAGSSDPVKSGGLYEKFTAIDAKMPSDATADNKLVAENRLAAYVGTIIEALDASFNLTSADGHVTFRLTQADGQITSVQIATDDIASAAALTALGGRVSTNERDIDALQDAYIALTQSDIVIVNGALPSSGQQQNIIYRQPDPDHTPPQFYSDFMWNGTTWVLMGQYNNAIDPRPKNGSQNLVTSGGVFDNIVDNSMVYFGGTATYSFTNKTLVLSAGYITLLNRLIHKSQQTSLDLNTLGGNSGWLLYDKTNGEFVIISADNLNTFDLRYFPIAFIDAALKNIIGNIRYMVDSDAVPAYNYSAIGIVRGTVELIFGENSWQIKNTSGAIANVNGNSYATLLAKEQTITDINLHYVFFDTSAQEIVVYRFDGRPSSTVMSDYLFIGIIQPQAKQYVLNSTVIKIDGETVANYTVEKNKTILGEETVYPTSSWLTKNWNTYLGTDGIFIDKRCIISKSVALESITIKMRAAGNVKVHLLDLDFNILRSETFSLSSGDNNVTISNIEYNAPMYVGVQAISDNTFGTHYPADNTGNSFKKIVATGEVLDNNYSFPYTIKVSGDRESIAYRVDLLEWNTKEEDDDTNDLSEIISNYPEGGLIELEAKEYTMSSTVEIPSGTKIIGVRGKTIVNVPSSILKGIELNGVEDVVIENITLKGAYNGTPVKNALQPVKSGILDEITYETGTTKIVLSGIGYQTDLTNGGVTSTYIPQIGINIYQCEKIEIIGCEIKNFSYYGLCNGLSGKNYRYACKFENNYINNCYCGIYLYNEAERSQYIANNVSLCQIGLFLDSGTNMFTDCAFSANRIGMLMNNGVNGAHGVQTGNAFTHCSLFSVYANNVEGGEVFTQCKFGYVDSETGNDNGIAIYSKNSRGLSFSNCQMVNCDIKFDGKFNQRYTSYSIGPADIFGNTPYDVVYTDISDQPSQYNGGVNQILGCCYITGGGNITISADLDSTNIIMKYNFWISGQSTPIVNN